MLVALINYKTIYKNFLSSYKAWYIYLPNADGIYYFTVSLQLSEAIYDIEKIYLFQS